MHFFTFIRLSIDEYFWDFAFHFGSKEVAYAFGVSGFFICIYVIRISTSQK